MSLNRDIARLALPALGALVVEPLFLLTDAALVGHLGVAPLAGLGLASAVLQTIVGLLVFLAYATTPLVARRLGAGDRPGAIRAGIDGIWFALGIGLLLLAGIPFARPIVELFGADATVTSEATTYLSISIVGLPAMLIVLAATGLLRGLQNTRTPLIVATVGFAANAGLNAVLIYGLGWGIAGSAAGTVIAQWAMAGVYVGIAVRAGRANAVSLRPGVAGVRSVATSGGWLLLRTLSLRVALLATTATATGLGTAPLATIQIAMTIYFTLAFVLDSLAIAGQALVGFGLGTGDVSRVRAVTRRLIQVAIGFGVIVGAVVAVLAPVTGSLFTTDTAIRAGLVPVLLVLAVGVPLAGFVFVIDGVLIGAGDVRYLALTGILNVIVFLPLLLLVHDTVGLWAAFGIGYIAARAITLGLRVRTTAWMTVGAS